MDLQHEIDVMWLSNLEKVHLNNWFGIYDHIRLWVSIGGKVEIGYNSLHYHLPPPFDFTQPEYHQGPHCAGFKIPHTDLVF